MISFQRDELKVERESMMRIKWEMLWRGERHSRWGTGGRFIVLLRFERRQKNGFSGEDV